MDINLKQPEIETAIRSYLTKLGIDLDGKTVGIDFTSGRKNNGLTAAVTITNELIPGFETNVSTDEPKSAEVIDLVNTPVADPVAEVAATEPEATTEAQTKSIFG